MGSPEGICVMVSMITRQLGVAATLAALLAPGLAHADRFVATYMGPGVQSVTADQVCSVSGCVLGTETFNSAATGNYSGRTLSTDFGTGGRITGTMTGNYQIKQADQYGGAGGKGNYAVTFDHNTGYTLSLNNAGKGVNYFGMNLMAIDPGNNLEFYSGNELVATYSSADMVKALGLCPGGPYCGNPAGPYQGWNGREQYAFVSFYDQKGTFDRIVFSEGKNYGGGFEADNFTVAYRSDTSRTPGTVLPAPLPPVGGSLLGSAMLGLAAWRRRRAAVNAPA